MATSSVYDAVVVGAGPNGLAAAITIARMGYSVLVIEAKETIGGGCRSGEITEPGFIHDICSAMHPMGLASSFMRSLPLAEHGVEWIHPPIPLAHPFDDGSVAILARSIEETSETLGRDGKAYRDFMHPLVQHWEEILEAFVGPLRIQPFLRPVHLTRFALTAPLSARRLARTLFKEPKAQALLAGICAHTTLPLEKLTSAGAGLVLGILGHAVGWPLARGGSQSITNAMASYLRSLGGEIRTGFEVKNLAELPEARTILCDITPRQLLRLAGSRLQGIYKQQLLRYRYGPGSFKVDYALDGPIPWRNETCRLAGTLHLGGTLEEISASERATNQGIHSHRPYMIVAQQSLFDLSRAPEGKQTAWVYCHVPHSSDKDMTDIIEAQIERFAPGFRDRIIARTTKTAVELETYNSNYIGGDINGGIQDMWQLFTRPAIQPSPYTTSIPGLYLCSSSTPPGGGVHGLCGYYAAQTALRHLEHARKPVALGR